MNIKNRLVSALLTVSLVTSGLSMPVSAAETTKGTVISSNASTSTAKTSNKSVTKAQKGVYTKTKLSWKNLKPDDFKYAEDRKAYSEMPLKYAYNKGLGAYIFKNNSKCTMILNVAGHEVTLGAYDMAVREAPKDARIALNYFYSGNHGKSTVKSLFTDMDVIIDSVKSVKEGTKITWHYNIPKGKYLVVKPVFEVYSKVDGWLNSRKAEYGDRVEYRLVKSSKTKFNMTIPIACNKTTVVEATMPESTIGTQSGYINSSDYKKATDIAAEDYFDVRTPKYWDSGNKFFYLEVKEIEPLKREFFIKNFVAYADADGSDAKVKAGTRVYGTVDLNSYNHLLSEYPLGIKIGFDTPVIPNTIHLKVFGDVGYNSSDVEVRQTGYEMKGTDYEVTFKNTGKVPVVLGNLSFWDMSVDDLSVHSGDIVFSDGTVVKDASVFNMQLFLDCNESVTFKFSDMKFKSVSSDNKWRFYDISTKGTEISWRDYLGEPNDVVAMSNSSVNRVYGN